MNLNLETCVYRALRCSKRALRLAQLEGYENVARWNRQQTKDWLKEARKLKKEQANAG